MDQRKDVETKAGRDVKMKGVNMKNNNTETYDKAERETKERNES
jgi:hypothetical protein